MKKKIVIISIIAMVIVSAYILGLCTYINYRDSQISLINESVIIEYGENYEPGIKYLIDVDKYNFINLNKVIIKNEIINEEEKDYPKVGDYFIHIYYKNIELVQKVEVKDSISPEVTINEKIELPYNTDLENYNFKDYIKINDLSETKEYNIDFSNVNKEVAGEYNATIEVKDIYDNKTQKEFKIIIQNKVEEKITNDIPSNNEVKTTSNQTKTQNNINRQTTNKTSTTNKESKSQTSSNNQITSTESTTNNNQAQETNTNTAYWCVEGGNHHLLGDGANEHGYYKTWDSAYQAFKEYTKDWDSCQYKVDVCGCGLYYFWAVK